MNYFYFSRKAQNLKRDSICAYERARYGHDHKVMWNFDGYHAQLMVDWLPRFKEYGGWPGSLETQEEWHHILDEMVEGFQFYLDHCHEWDNDIRKQQDKKLKRSFKLLNKYYGALWT